MNFESWILLIYFSNFLQIQFELIITKQQLNFLLSFFLHAFEKSLPANFHFL